MGHSVLFRPVMALLECEMVCVDEDKRKAVFMVRFTIIQFVMDMYTMYRTCIPHAGVDCFCFYGSPLLIRLQVPVHVRMGDTPTCTRTCAFTCTCMAHFVYIRVSILIRW